ncbi:MAG: hypothetical protein QOD45_572 [Pseudonocardiales bacterium]|nr:hypothetical protein [Pseudonocardiales bacterium]
MTGTLEQRFAGLLAAEPSRPFVTYYDEDTGERTELSVRSLANWVAKTHHLLGTELGLGCGDTALVALPQHWMTVPVLLGCATAGLTVTITPPAGVGFVTTATLDRAAAVPDVYAVAPQNAASGFGASAPKGTSDYVAAVRPQADAWPSVAFGAGAHDEFIDGSSRAEVAEQAVARAAELSLASGARVLSTRSWERSADWLDCLFAPLAVGGSVVYVANCTDPAVLERRAQQERVTARIR